jgi:hypothetical protein
MIHPDIRKFWEEVGYQVDNDWWTSEHVDYILKTKDGMTGAAAFRKRNAPIEYLFGGRLYSEEQMLRIVRLKAFL